MDRGHVGRASYLVGAGRGKDGGARLYGGSCCWSIAIHVTRYVNRNRTCRIFLLAGIIPQIGDLTLDKIMNLVYYIYANRFTLAERCGWHFLLTPHPVATIERMEVTMTPKKYLAPLFTAIDVWRSIHETVEAAMLSQVPHDVLDAAEADAAAEVRRVYAELVDAGIVVVRDYPDITSRIVCRHIDAFGAFMLSDPVDWGLRQAEKDRQKLVEWEARPKVERERIERLWAKPLLIPRDLRSERFFHNQRSTVRRPARAT